MYKQLPQTKNNLVQNINDAEVQKPDLGLGGNKFLGKMESKGMPGQGFTCDKSTIVADEAHIWDGCSVE